MQTHLKLLALVICLAVAGCGSQVPVGLASASEGNPTSPTLPVNAQPDVSESPQLVPPSENNSPVQESPLRNQSPSAVLANLLDKQGSVPFHSRADAPNAEDEAMTLTLLPGNVVRIVYQSRKSESNFGKFSVDEQGRLHLDFGPYDPWPRMQLAIHDGVLIVQPPKKEEIMRVAFEAGVRREEITDEDVAAAFQSWPLRQSMDDR